MKVKDIKQIKVTVIGNNQGYYYHQQLIDYTQTTSTIESILYKLSNKYKDAIDILRTKCLYGTDDYKKYKGEFPSWMVGGTFPLNDLHDESIITYSNLVAIDIDKSDNKDIDIDNVVKDIYKLPYVIGYSKSISGKGYYILILVEDGKNTTGYYKYIVNLWKHKYNINIDTACTNIGRKRFISYDENMKIKDDDVDIIPWKLIYIEPQVEQPKQQFINKQYNSNEKLIHSTISYLVNNGLSIDYFKTKDTGSTYRTWYHIGCDFCYFEDGYSLFEKFSNNSIKYNDSYKDILNKYNQCKCKTPIDEIGRKYCGIAKKIYGKHWINKINKQELC